MRVSILFVLSAISTQACDGLVAEDVAERALTTTEAAYVYVRADAAAWCKPACSAIAKILLRERGDHMAAVDRRRLRHLAAVDSARPSSEELYAGLVSYADAATRTALPTILNALGRPRAAAALAAIPPIVDGESAADAATRVAAIDQTGQKGQKGRNRRLSSLARALDGLSKVETATEVEQSLKDWLRDYLVGIWDDISGGTASIGWGEGGSIDVLTDVLGGETPSE